MEVASSGTQPAPLEGFLWLHEQMITKHLPKAMAVEFKKENARSDRDLLYLLAKRHKLIKLLFEVFDSLEKYNTDSGKEDLIGQLYSHVFGHAADFAPDIRLRLDWQKQRIGRELEKKFKSAINTHQVQSPIEQIILMEWIFRGIEHVHGVNLEPQKKLSTSEGMFTIDFVVSGKPDLKLAIEIDGHDFHEKTKKQVSRDKVRERAIVRAGYTPLRFSGSEVHQNPRKCVDDTVAVIMQRRTNTALRRNH